MVKNIYDATPELYVLSAPISLSSVKVNRIILNISFKSSHNVLDKDYEGGGLSKYLPLRISRNIQHSKLLHAEPFDVKVEEPSLPTIKHPDDVLVKVTTAAICGSDLHMYQGRTAAQGGLCFGTKPVESSRYKLLTI